MIASFTFSNFKSIHKPVELSFEATTSKELEDYYVVRATPKLRLLKMAVIYGANASGKSNVLEALDFLRRLVVEPAAKKTDPIVYDRFAFAAAARSGNSVFHIRFVAKGVLYDYRLELDTQAVVEESLHFYRPNRALVFRRTTDAEDRLAVIEFGSKVRLPAEDRHALSVNTLWNNTVLGGFLKVNIESPELLAAADWFGSVLSKLVTPGQDLYAYVTKEIQNGKIDRDNVIRILQKADFNIVGLTIDKKTLSPIEILKTQAKMAFADKTLAQLTEEGEFVDVKVVFSHAIQQGEKEIQATLPYEMQSLGTQRFYQFAGVLDLLIRGSRIAVFDEVEASLHPELLKFFMLLFLRNTNQSQLIFTTHQRDLLQDHEMLRPDVVHFTEKREDGSTELYSLADFDSSVFRKGSSLYNVYKSGKIGAVPELEDAYIPVD